MEDYKVLKQLLESMFEQNDLKSWTTHGFRDKCLLTLRFSAKVNNGSTNPTTRETVTFRKKSQYQISRDRQRLENFSNTRKTRSQTTAETEHVELKRGETLENNCENSSYTPGMSRLDPMSEPFFPDSPPAISMVTPEPSQTPVKVTLADMLEGGAAEDAMDSPDIAMPDTPEGQTVTDEDSLEAESEDDESINGAQGGKIDKPVIKLETKLQKTSYRAEFERFTSHISKYPNTVMKDIQCKECPVDLDSCINGYERLIYCEKCDMYICTKCRFPDRSSVRDPDEIITHSQSCNNPASYIT